MFATKAVVCSAAAALAAVAWAQPDEWSRLYIQASNLKQAGRYAEAAILYEEAVRAAEQPGQDATRAAWARNGLGMIDDESGRVTEAEREYRRSLALFEHAGANRTSDYALVLNNLAAHYSDLGRIAQAETLLRESIAIFSASVPVSTAGLALARGSLATVMMKNGHYGEAEALLVQAVSSLEHQPAQSERLAFELNNLGLLRKCQHRYQEAAEFFRQALAILVRALGADHPELLDMLNNLALVQFATGNRDEADTTFRRALTIAGARLGAAHPAYGQILVNYSVLLRKQGEKSLAGKLEAEGRAVLQKSARANGMAFTVDTSAFHQ
jgi:tetratricopeptide (TPR) repeat protein